MRAEFFWESCYFPDLAEYFQIIFILIWKRVLFFRGVHQQMRRQMRDMDRMMNQMMDPFGVFDHRSIF